RRPDDLPAFRTREAAARHLQPAEFPRPPDRLFLRLAIGGRSGAGVRCPLQARGAASGPAHLEHPVLSGRRPGEIAMDVGIQMVFASYGWDRISDTQVWDEE